ncbi:MAG: ROK family protein [Alicyclobacillus shizuokensis]|nr:ROK family protein [Alicyclobacillus shizuokensis]
MLDVIRLHGPVSRAELQQMLKIAFPTISQIVDNLMNLGWVRSAGMGDSRGGRPPELVEINPCGPGAIGIELGRNTVTFIHTNLLAVPVLRRELRLCDVKGPGGLVDLLEDFIQENKISSESILGFGIAAPGPLDPAAGKLLVLEDMPREWHEIDIVSFVSERFNKTAWLENDANSAALAEAWFGQLNTENVLFILADSGPGAGIIVNGMIYRGTKSRAGEFSHMIVDFDGPLCSCGRRGCVNAVASMQAIRTALSKVRPSAIDEPFLEILQRASAGMEPEHSVITRAIQFLGLAITNLVEAFDPGSVLLGGRLMLANDFVANGVINEVQRLILHSGIQIQVTHFGMDAVAVGAATLVLQNVYNPQRLITPQQPG